MKITKFAACLATALGVASVAQAQETVYVTGSTAFRAQVFYALQDMGLTPNAGSGTKNNVFTFTGTINNGTVGTLTNGSAGVPNVTIACGFSGSSEGVASVVNDVEPTLNYSNTVGGTFQSVTYANGGDLAFCDVEQASTSIPTPAAGAEIIPDDAAASAYGKGMAIVPFAWCASTDAAARVKNVTAYNLSYLLANGKLGLPYLTGTNTGTVDSGTNVVLIGRTNDSGSRIATQNCMGLPTAVYDSAQPMPQYAISNNPSITSFTTGTYGLISQGGGNNQTAQTGKGYSGYASGGTIATALSLVGAGYGLGYLGWPDAGSCANGALPVSFNGVSPFVGPTWTANSTPWNVSGVENGQYVYWSYEHLYENSVDVGATTFTSEFGKDLANAVEYEIQNPKPGQIQTADVIAHMNVHKNNDGAYPTFGN